MQFYYKSTTRLWRNAFFILETLTKCKPDETVLVIADHNTYKNARVLCDCAKEIGMKPLLIDIDIYEFLNYRKIPFIPALKAAIEAADVSLNTTEQMYTDFGIFFGNSDECDTALLGKQRRFTLEIRGMEEWDFNSQEVLIARDRTNKLLELLKKSRNLHVTTTIGTDFNCQLQDGLDGIHAVMAIIPFYSEVAIIPKIGSISGELYIDGASQHAHGAHKGFPIRPNFPGGHELHREPLRININKGIVAGYSGDPIQVDRLKKWIEESEPKSNIVDEIGIVTTTSKENDIYGWLVDGTHQTHCIHVALGNNNRRNECIHAPEHVDFDMHDPIIEVDGKIIYKNKIFNDEFIFS